MQFGLDFDSAFTFQTNKRYFSTMRVSTEDLRTMCKVMANLWSLAQIGQLAATCTLTSRRTLSVTSSTNCPQNKAAPCFFSWPPTQHCMLFSCCEFWMLTASLRIFPIASSRRPAPQAAVETTTVKSKATQGALGGPGVSGVSVFPLVDDLHVRVGCVPASCASTEASIARSFDRSVGSTM